MRYLAYAMIFVGIVAFDVFVLGGAAWLIGWKGWSKGTMVLALILAFSSTPITLIKAIRDERRRGYCPKCGCNLEPKISEGVA